MQRLKELEKENGRLKKLVAEQALDMAILKEVAQGKWEARRANARRSGTSGESSKCRSAGPVW